MSQISPTQQRILTAASKHPKADVREQMLDIKSPAIRDKIIESMLKHGLVAKGRNGEDVAYIITDAGLEAVGAGRQLEAETTPQKTKPGEPKGVSKQQIILFLLERSEGATLKQLMDATGWQKHSLHGAMANMKKKLHIAIESTKETGGERIYRVA